jgi:uncharacterized protein YndB with AHSA1/START domain
VIHTSILTPPIASASRTMCSLASPRSWFDVDMTDNCPDGRVVSATHEIAAPAADIFELIADPAQQPRWDGNANLAEAATGQRVRQVGDVFLMTLTRDAAIRENHIVEFEEGRLIAWRPSEVGRRPPGHLWRWELEPLDARSTRVTHTYDWTELTDRKRLPRARSTTPDKLLGSITRLAAIAESASGRRDADVVDGA